MAELSAGVKVGQLVVMKAGVLVGAMDERMAAM